MVEVTQHSIADPIEVRVTAIRYAAKHINTYEFCDVAERPLPAAAAGAHIDVVLPVGVRQYSLLVDQPAAGRYVVAVKQDKSSRGGSRYMHEDMRVGDILAVSAPRNHFELFETAPHTVLIAGGIGITPIWSMLRRLETLGRSWELHYACRAREEMAFHKKLSGRAAAHLHLDEEHDGPLKIAPIVDSAPADAHFYCCGPRPMLEAFAQASKAIDPQRIHVEYFQPKDAPSLDGGFVVELAKSGFEISVPPGKTILQMVENAGIHVEHSCAEGICGTCEIRVISGTPDHRDSVLTASERAANKSMMICCSGSKSSRLVLDL